MKVYKLEVLIVDEDVDSIEEAEDIINETRYPNHINVFSVNCREAEIGEWEDSNPLNGSEKEVKDEVERLFPNAEIKALREINTEIIKTNDSLIQTLNNYSDVLQMYDRDDINALVYEAFNNGKREKAKEFKKEFTSTTLVEKGDKHYDSLIKFIDSLQE